MIALYPCFGVLGLNGYTICVHRSSRDWMGTMYVSFEVVGFIWLLYMHPLEFQGLDNYYICIIWTFKGHDVLRNAPKTFLYFNTWGTNPHLIQHKHYCWIFTGQIHMATMTCQFVFTSWHFFLSRYILTCHGIYQKNIPFDMEWMYLKYPFLHLFTYSCSCSHVRKIAIPINYLYL